MHAVCFELTECSPNLEPAQPQWVSCQEDIMDGRGKGSGMGGFVKIRFEIMLQSSKGRLLTSVLVLHLPLSLLKLSQQGPAAIHISASFPPLASNAALKTQIHQYHSSQLK